MALGTITVGDDKLLKASAPAKVYQLSFAGDDAYVKGTGTAFQALVRAAVGETVTVAAVVHGWATTPKYELFYDDANDKLKILDVNAGDEAANGNYSTTTFYCTVIAI